MPLRLAQGTPIAPSPSPDGREKVLPVPFVSQNGDGDHPYTHLCWACCGEMLLQYKGVTNVPLGEVVSSTLNADCHADPGSERCDQAAMPDVMLHALGFTFQTVNAPLTSTAVPRWIDVGKPLEVYFLWNSQDSAHTALIIGYRDDGGGLELLVNDPLRGQGWHSYDEVLYAYGEGTWQITWYDIEKV